MPRPANFVRARSNISDACSKAFDGDPSDIEARTAQNSGPLDASRPKSELSSANGSRVPSDAASNRRNNVVVRGGHYFPHKARRVGKTCPAKTGQFSQRFQRCFVLWFTAQDRWPPQEAWRLL